MAILEIDGLEKHFGGLPAVDGVTLGVDEGEILAIVGPNGAGKSTLLKSIMGLLKPTRGTITFDGLDLTGLPTHRIRHRGVAMVLQTPLMFPSMTVQDNVLMGAIFGGSDGLREESAARDDTASILEFIDFGTKGGLPVGQMNLHEQRFVELARALGGRPRLLLLDEVMAGLNDTEIDASIRMVRTAVDRFGITVIWVEHVMKAVVSLAQRVSVLDFGRIIADGDPEVVMRDPAVVEAYLGRGAVGGA